MEEMKKADLILVNCYIITMDTSRRIIENGAIAINNGKIDAVGRKTDVLREFAGEQYDCNGAAVHPGFIDAHEHVSWHIVRSVVPDTFTGQEIWEKFEDPLIRNILPQDDRTSTILATMEMAVNGTTMFGDTGGALFVKEMFEGANQVGIKGYTGYLLGDNYVPELKVLHKSTRECLNLLEEQMTLYPRSSKMKVGALVGLVGSQNCTGDLFAGAKDVARKHSVQMQIHSSVTREEVDYFLDNYGKTPIEFYDDLGILDKATTLVHVIHTTENDLDILERTGASVVHCPGASAKHAKGALHAPFDKMHERGINIALGTDAGNWSDGLNIAQQMYLTAVGHRECKGRLPVFTGEDVFEMATINGAAALGAADECGSIEVGKAADIVIHTIYRPEMLPAQNRVAAIVYASQSSSIESVLVDGEFIVKNGQLTKVDIKKLAPAVNEQQQELLDRMNFKVKQSWPVI